MREMNCAATRCTADTDLVTRFDVICVEDLNLRGMVKNHSLARAVSDASIGTAIRMVDEKAERYGKAVIKIDRWFPSSKTCSDCGHIVETLPLSAREWMAGGAARPMTATRTQRRTFWRQGMPCLRMEGLEDERRPRLTGASPSEVRTNKALIVRSMVVAVGISVLQGGEDVTPPAR